MAAVEVCSGASLASHKHSVPLYLLGIDPMKLKFGGESRPLGHANAG
jgi:hypothetical protein